MKISNREIANWDMPYLIAEISCNHMGGFDNARQLVRVAARVGADAVKFQVYTPDTLTLDCNKPDFIIQEGLWKGRTLYDLYKTTYTPWEWFPKLFTEARRCGITAFASVFDHSSVEYMEKVGCPAYKIASMEIVDTNLIRYAASTGKPMIVSTGMASVREIIAASEAVNHNNSAFLHCTSEYPGTEEWADLERMEVLRQILPKDMPIGLSDHTSTAIVPILSVAKGCAVIEKHLMLGYGREEDNAFSLTPDKFREMVTSVKTAFEALKPRTFISNPSHQFRRSLYAVSDIKEGETITDLNVRSIRPGYGISPRHLSDLLGKAAKQNYRKGDRIT